VVCPAAQERLLGVWDDARRVAMRDAFTASTLPYAVDAWNRTEERLDAHAERWSERYDALCQRLGGGEQSRSLDATMACLRQRREELGALVELLADGDEATIAKATEAAADLTPVDVCEEQGAEAAQMALPAAADQPEVDEIRLVLARAEAAYKTGMVGRGMEHARQAHERAQALGYLPLEVEALYFRGKLEVIDGQLAAAEQDLADAALRAVEARYDRIAVRAATTQAFVVGYQQGRPDEGMKWLRHATAALERLGNDRLLDAELRITRASILTSQGRFEPALVDFRAGLLERQEVLGDGHPTVAASYNNLGSVLVEVGRLDEALEALEHARRIWEHAYGPRHPVLGTALTGIGAILEQMGRWPEARERLEQALRVREDAFGPDHFNVAITLDNLGSVLARLGETDRARSVIERSLTLRERTLGPRHPHIGSSLVNLGLVAELEGKLDEACDYEERAIELWEETLGAEHPYLTVPLTILGRAELARGNPERARQLLERALAIGEEVDKPSERAETRLALARALWEQDPAQARILAERARADVQGPSAGKVALRGQIDRWLADHPS
ncbi:MAG: tetratricopeptide repeat protein, partial [Nannocystaceae bacterium]